MLMPSRPIGNSGPQVSASGSFGQLELSVSQMPEKSGFPSGVLGVGADRLGFPSGVLGTFAVGYFNHWATTVAEKPRAKLRTIATDNGRTMDVRMLVCKRIFGIYGFFIAESQCSSAFPSLMRHMSNHVVVEVFDGSFGSLFSRGRATLTKSPSAVTETILLLSFCSIGLGCTFITSVKNFTTPGRPEAAFGLCWMYRPVRYLPARSQ